LVGISPQKWLEFHHRRIMLEEQIQTLRRGKGLFIKKKQEREEVEGEKNK
jgi:hypothetical protein